MEISGTIKQIGEIQTFGSNGFQKREVVITTDEQYPQHILIEFIQDKCAILDKYNVGQQVVVSINIRGREWVNPQGETKYFNTLQGWKIGALNQAPKIKPATPAPKQFESNSIGEGGLPF